MIVLRVLTKEVGVLPVEMFLNWAELQPADIITLLRNVNLVQDISLACPPEQTPKHLVIVMMKMLTRF